MMSIEKKAGWLQAKCTGYPVGKMKKE